MRRLCCVLGLVLWSAVSALAQNVAQDGVTRPGRGQDAPVEGAVEPGTDRVAAPLRPLPASADMQPVLQGERVQLDMPRPGLVEYLRHVVQKVLLSLTNWASGGLQSWAPWLAVFFEWVTYGLLIGLGLLWLLLMLGRRRARVRESPDEELATETTKPTVEDRRRMLESRLAAGDAAGALETLWWWWADRLAVPEVDEAWTTRELVRAAGREDLRSLARRFDYLAYGGAACRVEDVRGLWRRLEKSGGEA